ncbi:MAG: N-formylglutamate amidohydrolase [Alphaproteobacteria bacterium PA4]|nr:MAG: N-formylglutamate amidohydrolase [Alphaproteobacteria bacterium PA4]
MTLPRCLAGTAPLLLIADHASNAVPPGVDLDIPAALLDNHIAVDIGTAPLTAALAAALDAPAIIASVSRLVIDCNRDPLVADVIPVASDGHVIPGNLALSPTERALRIDAIHAPYHAAIADRIARQRPALIVSVHSFTPQLATRPEDARPWPIGILYNEDDRAARAGLAWLAGQGIHVGDNQPYSGRVLNYTMNRHAEAAGIPYLGLELRQDEIGDAAGQVRWLPILTALINAVQQDNAANHP